MSILTMCIISGQGIGFRQCVQGIGGGFDSTRKSDGRGNEHGRKGREEFRLERNRSARYSPNNIDSDGLLRLYLGGRRNGSRKGQQDITWQSVPLMRLANGHPLLD